MIFNAFKAVNIIFLILFQQIYIMLSFACGIILTESEDSVNGFCNISIF